MATRKTKPKSLRGRSPSKRSARPKAAAESKRVREVSTKTKRAADEAALLREIAASPDDDAPRLVYADLVAERGDTARAELIQLQIARAKAGTRTPSRRETSLVARNARRWLAPIVPEIRKGTWTFTRGFLDAVTLGQYARRGGDPLWATVRVLERTGKANLPIILDPVMRNLRRLYYGGTALWIRELMASQAKIAELYNVQLTNLSMMEADRAALIAATGLPDLRVVQFANASLDDAAAIWRGGLDREGVELVFWNPPQLLASWWIRLVTTPPARATVTIATAQSQSRLIGPRQIELRISPADPDLGRHQIAATLNLLEDDETTVHQVFVRVPVGWSQRALPPAGPTLQRYVADLRRIAAGCPILEEGDFPVTHLADPREY